MGRAAPRCGVRGAAAGLWVRPQKGDSDRWRERKPRAARSARPAGRAGAAARQERKWAARGVPRLGGVHATAGIGWAAAGPGGVPSIQGAAARRGEAQGSPRAWQAAPCAAAASGHWGGKGGFNREECHSSVHLGGHQGPPHSIRRGACWGAAPGALRQGAGQGMRGAGVLVRRRRPRGGKAHHTDARRVARRSRRGAPRGRGLFHGSRRGEGPVSTPRKAPLQKVREGM
ncbi:MAG: hypothetical protein J3K34DRAFT_405082 [Monoraphidium minutum]|nr:MAG: hypothetical protein J3K34DRAFT_405082 [Monoraphidium minutum]